MQELEGIVYLCQFANNSGNLGQQDIHYGIQYQLALENQGRCLLLPICGWLPCSLPIVTS